MLTSFFTSCPRDQRVITMENEVSQCHEKIINVIIKS